RAAGEVAGARHLDGDDAVQLRVAGLVDGAEGAVADHVEQLELAELVSGLALRAGGGPGLQVEGGAAGGAGDLLVRGDLHQLDGVVAVRAEDVHGPAPRRPRRFSPRPGRPSRRKSVGRLRRTTKPQTPPKSVPPTSSRAARISRASVRTSARPARSSRTDT